MVDGYFSSFFGSNKCADYPFYNRYTITSEDKLEIELQQNLFRKSSKVIKYIDSQSK